MADKTNLAPRFVRKTIILAARETIYGTAPAFVPATDALMVSDVSLTYNSNNVKRDVIRGYLGASEELAGDDHMQISFTCDLAPSGTVATAPAIGKLFRACGMAEVIVATKGVYYKPISTLGESVAFKYALDGVSYTTTGARGTFDLMLGIGEIPKAKFTFTCRYSQLSPVAEVITGIAYSQFKNPLVVTSYNSGMVNIGASLALATLALTGGDQYASRGFSFNLGNSVVYQPMLGVDRVLISDREATGSITLDLSAADEVSFRTDVRNNTAKTLTFDHGTTAGAKLLVHAQAAQLTNPQIVDQDGIAMTSFDARFMPKVGDDEVTIAFM